jgi:DNA-binding response OmpR family regulator
MTKTPHILNVDDHREIRELVSRALAKEGFRVSLAVLIKFAVIGALGAPAVSVLVFEVLLDGTAVFNHSNIRLP